MKSLLAIAAVLVLASGCASIQLEDTRTIIEKAVPYVEPASYFACEQVLSLSETPEDRTAKAEVVYSIAASIRSLSDGKIPSPKEIENLVSFVSPSRPHWATLGQELSSVYANFFDEISSDRDARTILIILGEIAEGCERAAEPYVRDEFLTDYELNHVVPFNLKKKNL